MTYDGKEAEKGYIYIYVCIIEKLTIFKYF